MEENLNINNQVNKEISDNTAQKISEDIKEPESEKDINIDKNNVYLRFIFQTNKKRFTMDYKKLLKSRKFKVAVWGTGYIGLSTMVYFSKKKNKMCWL